MDIRERFTAYPAHVSLLNDLPSQQVLHLCRRPDLTVTSRMMGIFDTLDRLPGLAPRSGLLATTAEDGPMNRATFIATEFH